MGAKCDLVQQLNATQTSTDQLDWVVNSRVPVLIGGHVGFLLAYFLGLYTIFHVARAYKKLELKVRLNLNNSIEFPGSCCRNPRW